jgi:hypothetical protein
MLRESFRTGQCGDSTRDTPTLWWSAGAMPPPLSTTSMDASPCSLKRTSTRLRSVSARPESRGPRARTNARRTRIEAVLDELLDRRLEVDDDLAGRDTMHAPAVNGLDT